MIELFLYTLYNYSAFLRLAYHLTEFSATGRDKDMSKSEGWEWIGLQGSWSFSDLIKCLLFSICFSLCVFFSFPVYQKLFLCLAKVSQDLRTGLCKESSKTDIQFLFCFCFQSSSMSKHLLEIFPLIWNNSLPVFLFLMVLCLHTVCQWRVMFMLLVGLMHTKWLQKIVLVEWEKALESEGLA